MYAVQHPMSFAAAEAIYTRWFCWQSGQQSILCRLYVAKGAFSRNACEIRCGLLNRAQPISALPVFRAAP